MKIDFVEKITKIFPCCFLYLLCWFGYGFALLSCYFRWLIYWVPEIGFVASFAIIAGIYLILLVVMVAFRKIMIINPLLRIIVGMFL